MGTTIKYTPTADGIILPGGKSDMRKLQEVFGDPPIILEPGDIEKLTGMAAMADTKLFKELIVAIDGYGEIRVWAEY